LTDFIRFPRVRTLYHCLCELQVYLIQHVLSFVGYCSPPVEYLCTGRISVISGPAGSLIANNASEFAAFLQSEPTVLQLYLSGRVKTVFAPIDLIQHHKRDKSDTRKLKERETPEERQRKLLQGSEAETDIGTASQTEPGEDVPTLDTPPLLGGLSQQVLVDNRPLNLTSPTKRWDSSPLAPRYPHQSFRSSTDQHRVPVPEPPS
jgi:hypothetical protein